MVDFDFEFEGQFSDTNDYVSSSIELNNGNIITATLFLSADALSTPDNFTFYLSNDGGSTWEEVSRNVEHTFSTTGQDLRYKISAFDGDVITIKQSDASDDFIKVTHTR